MFPHTDARSWFVGNQPLIETTAFRNGTLQGGYFILAARTLGLDCGPMSGFDNAAVDAAFFAGTTIRSNFLCNLGYGDGSKLLSAQQTAIVRRGVPRRVSYIIGVRQHRCPTAPGSGRAA